VILTSGRIPASAKLKLFGFRHIELMGVLIYSTKVPELALGAIIPNTLWFMRNEQISRVVVRVILVEGQNSAQKYLITNFIIAIRGSFTDDSTKIETAFFFVNQISN
jgi:hypothetical protein